MVYRKGTISNYIFNKHGFILLMAIIMLFAMLTGCSGQKPADSAMKTRPKSELDQILQTTVFAG